MAHCAAQVPTYYFDAAEPVSRTPRIRNFLVWKEMWVLVSEKDSDEWRKFARKEWCSSLSYENKGSEVDIHMPV
jgi:hypothetical protein